MSTRLFAILMIAATAAGLPAMGDPTAADGQKIFNRTCALCHSIEPGQNLVGPSLAGVVGRKAGQVEGFPYSDANRKSGLTWDPQTLNTYLTSPRGLVPGTKMSFPGLKNPDDRAAIIAFLESKSASN
ncbi:MAG TPA: cytochrome c family protein [Alphaproteobacteria bacterium]|nr:cytochrome c family protein [Alphaproteobacteria bacterium]